MINQNICRVIKDIHIRCELLVLYRDDYAKSMGINVKEMEKFKGKEDHTTVGVK